jgi:hypothetical protein
MQFDSVHSGQDFGARQRMEKPPSITNSAPVM